MDGQGTIRPRNIAKNFNPLSIGRTNVTDRQPTDRRTHIANVNSSSRSLKIILWLSTWIILMNIVPYLAYNNHHRLLVIVNRQGSNTLSRSLLPAQLSFARPTFPQIVHSTVYCRRLRFKWAWLCARYKFIWPSKPKFKPIAPVGASRQMGEISLSRGFYLFFYFFWPQFLLASRD